jgi:hypothetical protein
VRRRYAAELETLAQRFEAFKASAAAVLEFSDHEALYTRLEPGRST